MLQIRVTQDGKKTKEIAWQARELPIGRSPEVNDLVLSDRFISAQHGLLEARSKGWYYRDLGRSNGSILERGEKKIAVHLEAFLAVALNEGDRIQLGNPDKEICIEIHKIDAAPEELETKAEPTVLASRLILRDEITDHEIARRQIDYEKLFYLWRGLITDMESAQGPVRLGHAVFKAFPQSVHFVLMQCKAGAEGKLLPWVSLERRAYGIREVPLKLPRGWEESILGMQEAILYEEPQTLERVAAVETPRGQHAGMAACLRSRTGKVLGAIWVETPGGPNESFSEKDLEVFALFVGQASVSLENRVLYESLQRNEKRLISERSYLQSLDRAGLPRDVMIGKSRAIQKVRDFLVRIAESGAPVLLEGETGVGKEIAARFLYEKGSRREGLLCPVNCSAIPENLLESELFGYKKGAFTGATQDKKGLVELANNGILFLDEIAEMPHLLQAKLLRFLEDGEFVPVGGTHIQRVDVRIVAATNKELDELIKDGRFREDLYWRINSLHVKIPPLRERKADVVLLANYFLEHFKDRYHKNIDGISDEMMDCLKNYSFPGNVRELKSEIERAVTLTESGILTPDLLSSRILQEILPGERDTSSSHAAGGGVSLGERVSDVERGLLRVELAKAGWNLSQTARNLGLTRQGLKKKMKRYGIERPE